MRARMTAALAIAALIACLGAAPAAAAPVLEVDLQRDAAEVSHSDERIVYEATVENAGSDATLGQVSLEVQVPHSAETYVFKTSGWSSCTKESATAASPASVLCTRSNPLAAGAFAPALVVTAALGADAPDLATATATVFGGGALFPASDADQVALDPVKRFGFEYFDGSILDHEGNDYTQAGGHPTLARGEFEVINKRNLTGGALNRGQDSPVGHAKHVIVDLPRGFVGNAQALPELCSSIEEVIGILGTPTCPRASAVGGIDLLFSGQPIPGPVIFALEPEEGVPAQFAFKDPLNNVYTFSPKLRAGEGYAISLESAPVPGVDLLTASPVICGFGAKLTATVTFAGCKAPGEADPDGGGAATAANPLPLITNPTRCEAAGPVATLRADAWEDPGALNPDGSPDLGDPRWVENPFENPPITGCEAVGFEPEMSLQPTSERADSASGLEIELSMPTEGLEGKDEAGEPDPEAVAQANLRRARIAFPAEMAVNATAGQGLGACSAAQVKLGTNEPISCPEDSKIGTVEIDTPLIAEPLQGAIYVARQGEVGGALIGLYMVFESKKDGLLIKVPSRVDPQPDGRLLATVDNIPEAPFSAVRISFPQGPQAPLQLPQRCGSYRIEAELTPWTGGPPVPDTSTFAVNSGPDGGACPDGGLKAHLNAGVTEPVAGKPSPFTMRLTRDEGSQRLSGLDLRMPEGLTASLRGVPYCPDAVLSSISSAPGSGQAEIDSPSCPAGSLLGRVSAAAGTGSEPFYLDTGRAYLAGPYKGAPLSIAVVAPAVAGPLDLGNVVVRSAALLDPQTARVSVVSDPIPTIVNGIRPNVRELRVAIDRPGFVQNPTSCEETAVTATAKGEEGAAVDLSSRFRVGGCGDLGFKPRVSLRFFGGTNRGDYQGLRAVVRPRAGDANIAGTVVRFPRSAFVAQEHIRTVCTRVQFKADACPQGSIYGKAIAYSPLLDYPLSGNVYLRSSDNELPDAVADLRGPPHQPVRIELAIRTDSVKGALRNTVQLAPDAPATYFRLQLFGGEKGLIVNSRNICTKANRATVSLTAHNGRKAELRPRIANSRCNKQRRAKRARHSRR